MCHFQQRRGPASARLITAPTLLLTLSVNAGGSQGKAKVEHLLVSVVQSLLRSGLSAATQSVDSRLLSRPPAELFEARRASTGGWECQFKPMVELLLREILAISSRTDESAEAREGEIARVMALAGF
jgi:hypothetical protein